MLVYLTTRKVDSAGTKTFAKEPLVCKIIDELKLTPVSYNEKGPLVFFDVCNGKFAMF